MKKYINSAVVIVAAIALFAAFGASAQNTLQATMLGPVSSGTYTVGQNIAFGASATGGRAPYVYSWNFGDGEGLTGQSFNRAYSQAGSYTVTLTVTDFDNSTSVVTRNITVGAVQVAPTVDLKANNESGSTSVNTNQAVTLSWSTTNATSCTASGAWTGSKSLGSSEVVGPFSTAGNRTFTLTCTGPGGTGVDHVTVNVQAVQSGAVSVDLKANNSDGPLTIATSTQFTLAWTSQNAASCTASGEWSGSKATSGSETQTTPSTTSTSRTYTITCTGTGGGTATDTVTVSTTGSSQPGALTISNVRVTDVTRNSAVIRWTTNKPATSRVVYDTVSRSLGSAPNYGYQNTTSTTDENPMVTEHAVTVSGLSSNTTYYFRVISEA